MPRGNDVQTKVHYQGETDDFIIFIESAEELEKWKKDSSIPLAQVVSGWKVFVTHKQGAQGVLDTASNATLDQEFGTTKDEEVVKIILEKGNVQSSDSKERQGDTNVANGGLSAH
ncbi:putative RNA binding protein [Dendryphion nanum]|uniref:RNA binding protein n=1 Tax=Dendryphion nanum TaxID=256645 RepID=A0A9P9EHM6_9PLEO|nr:putative RNA binding protein [Dendryphion nanum]